LQGRTVSAAAAAHISLFVLRTGLGVVFLAHGYNHVFGGGKIVDTARWFASLGMRPGILHAWFASLTELGAGALLLLGLATPVACAAVVGTMLVALITNHLKNGFFIFRPGEGYEYVPTLIIVAAGLAGVGPGERSLDSTLGWFQPPGWLGLGIALIAGISGATSLLVVCWRPKEPKVVAGATAHQPVIVGDTPPNVWSRRGLDHEAAIVERTP
jgi:putative oxidoreductase